MKNYMDEINKRLTLSEKPTENQVIINLLEVRQLMMNNKLLKRETAPAEENFKEVDTGFYMNNETNIDKMMLAEFIAEYNCCKASRVGACSKMAFKKIYISGKESDVDIVLATIKYCIEFIEWEEKYINDLLKKHNETIDMNGKHFAFYRYSFPLDLPEYYKKQNIGHEEWADIL
ncbi:MAG: hypothetical protein RR263_01850 [Oscillospiraceae bacterium]